jgi:hypothetical protein
VGINLFANPTLGTANNATVIKNRICGSAIPINIQPGASAAKLRGNKLTPCHEDDQAREDDNEDENDRD